MQFILGKSQSGEEASSMNCSSKTSKLFKYFKDFKYCVKSVQIRNIFWSVFTPNTGKYRPEKTPYLDTFQAVKSPMKLCSFLINSFECLIYQLYHTLLKLFKKMEGVSKLELYILKK